MTNLPFGFQPDNGDDDDDDRRASGAGSGPGGIPGFDPAAGFDLGQLGNMLSQLGQMMSQAGASGSESGPINYDMAQKIALQAIGATHPASSVDVDQMRQAVQLAEVWLEGVTGFPAGASTATAWSPKQWVEGTMPAWKQLCTPIAERVSSAWTESLPEEIRGQVGPLLGMLGSMGGMTFGSQLGQGLARLSGEVLTSTDIGLPMAPAGTAALLPAAVIEFAKGVSVDEDQVRLYLAAREAAHHRLYAATPWLREKVVDLVTAYARGIAVDFSEMEDIAGKLDPSDPASMQELLSGEGLAKGLFEPKISPGQQTALRNLETLLALVEGWVDTVVTEAVGERLPAAGALQETMRRRRASGGPAEQAFASLIGLQMRPRRLRAAATLWQAVGQSRGSDGRDALWSHPDLLPGSDDLDDPTGFVDRDRQFSELLAGLSDVQSLGDLEGFDPASEEKDPSAEDRSADDGTGGAGSSQPHDEGTDSTDGEDDEPPAAGA